MLSSILVLFLGGARIPIGHHFDPPRLERYLFDSKETAWLSIVDESAEARQTLWDAQYVLFYAGRVTGDPPGLFILAGNRLHERIIRGWHMIERPKIIEPDDFSLVSRRWCYQPSRPVVIVIDERDRLDQDTDGFKALNDKISELKKDGVKQIIVMQRGTADPHFSFPILASSPTMVLYWISDGELSVLFNGDFQSMPLAAQEFTLESSRDSVLGGVVAVYSPSIGKDLHVSSEFSAPASR